MGPLTRYSMAGTQPGFSKPPLTSPVWKVIRIESLAMVGSSSAAAAFPKATSSTGKARGSSTATTRERIALRISHLLKQAQHAAQKTGARFKIHQSKSLAKDV